MDNTNNYLKSELYELIKNESGIFDFLQEGSLDGIWYWDLEKPENEWMSERFWLALGYDPKTKDHLASEWQDIIFQEDLALAIENFNKHCQDPTHPYDQIVRYHHANGSVVWIHCRGLAIRDDSGKPIRMLGAHTDITKLKLVEQQHQDSLKKLDDTYHLTKLALEESEQLFELSPDAIIKVDHTGNIVKANKQATELFGYSKAEFALCSLEKLLPQAVKSAHKGYFQQYFNQGGARKMGADRGKLKAITKSGDQISVEITLNLVQSKSGKHAIATIRNIQEKEQLIESLKNQIEENKKLERFAFVASHDLQEPLRKINAFADLLENRFDVLNIVDEEALFSLTRLKSASSRMRNIIQDTLKLSQISASSISPSYWTMDEVLDEVKKRLYQQIADSNALIKITNGEQKIYADYSLITQLFQNLVSNAIKFQRQDVQPEVQITIETNKRFLEISVVDNGVGISSEYQQHIFEPFTRLHTRNEFQGNGIGLAIAKQIVEIHSGTIECIAEEGKGTTMKISIPSSNK